MRFCTRIAMMGALLALSGCRSAFVDATVRNASSQNITLVEVDYPSASFGWQVISPGTDRHYRFKILGSGPLKLTYTDASGREQHASGPVLREGESGALRIIVAGETVSWQPALKNP